MTNQLFIVHKDRKKRHEWRDMEKEIFALIEQDVCISQQPPYWGIRRSHAKQVISSKADTIMYTRNPHGQMNAFLAIKWHPDVMETLAVCSKKELGGSVKEIVMQSLLFARTTDPALRLPKKFAELHALTHVRSYYPHFKYYQVGPNSNGNPRNGWLFRKNLANTENWVDVVPGVKTPEQRNLVGIHIPKKKVQKPPQAYVPSDRFPPKTIVWAKVEGYPYWPAQVKIPSQKYMLVPHSDSSIFVSFYGTGEVGWIKKALVRHFEDHMETLPKTASKSQRKQFEQGVAEAQHAMLKHTQHAAA